ncbi:MAG: MDR family MFS transporter [Saprospiraceae bacterium]
MLHRTVTLYRNAFGGLSKDIWLLAFVTFINRSGTMVVPFLTVYLTSQLHFSLPQAGWVMLCFGVGSVIGTLIGGKLTDKIGYYKVQFWSLVLSGIMFITLLVMHSFWQVCAAVFVLAVVADAFRPANHASIAIYSKPENRTRSYSLVRLAINLGFSIGPAAGGLIAASAGYSWLFWVDGITCIVASGLFLFFLKEKQEEKTSETEAATAATVIHSPYKDRNFLLFGLLTMLSAMVFMQLFSTIPVFYKREFAMSEGQIGLLLALNGLIIALVEMPIIYTIEGRIKSKLHIIGFGTLLIGASYCMLELAGFWQGIAIISIITVTFGEIFMMPFSNVFALERSSPSTRGQYMAVYSSTWSVAHILAPVIGLQIANAWGFSTLWYVLTGICLLAFFGYKMLEKQPDRNKIIIQSAVPEPVAEV